MVVRGVRSYRSTAGNVVTGRGKRVPDIATGIAELAPLTAQEEIKSQTKDLLVRASTRKPSARDLLHFAAHHTRPGYQELKDTWAGRTCDGRSGQKSLHQKMVDGSMPLLRRGVGHLAREQRKLGGRRTKSMEPTEPEVKMENKEAGEQSQAVQSVAGGRARSVQRLVNHDRKTEGKVLKAEDEIKDLNAK
ncbi:hypothetical protein AK812_SmicGene9233 [Symbiodinium microadriaticum]|uniref:Uncharacterized protein n=1 Tax=Symbiodinium microadriaticum TaxID=2951 RepID=A0A1Q9EIZ2_SYMMI|nr:hypothetical protein AK812_SmicGene9233 [Symbiodinium microadriaticum]